VDAAKRRAAIQVESYDQLVPRPVSACHKNSLYALCARRTYSLSRNVTATHPPASTQFATPSLPAAPRG
jgi:hypothetical protein